MWHRWEYWFWAGIATLILLAVIVLTGRAEAHPAHLIPDDGVMTMTLAAARSHWFWLQDLEARNGPYREEVMPYEPDPETDSPVRRDRVGAPPLAPAEIRVLVEAYFPPEHVETALCIFFYESRWNPDAKNPHSSAAGVAQFLESTWDRAATALGLPSYAEGGPLNPVFAVRAAAWLQARGTGWRQWSVHDSCGV